MSPTPGSLTDPTPEEREQLASMMGFSGVSNPEMANQLLSQNGPQPGSPLIGPGGAPAQPQHMPDSWALTKKALAPNPDAPNIDYTSPELSGGGDSAIASTRHIAPEAQPGAQAQAPAPPQPPDMSKVVPTAGGQPQQGAQGPNVAPARIQPAGWTNTMAPQERAQMAAGQANELAGIRGGAEAKSSELANEADIRKGGYDQVEAQRLRDQSEFEKQTTAGQNVLKGIEARRAAYEDKKIDPNHFYKNKSTAQVIGLAIAQGMGTFGQLMTGSRSNSAMEIIQQAIDRDVDAQRDALSREGKGIEHDQSLYAENLRALGDHQRAAAATRQEMLQGVEYQAKTAALQSGSAEAKANAQQLIGTVQQKQAQELAQWNKYHPAAILGGGAGGIPEKEQGLIFKDPVSGGTFKARDTESRKKLTESATSADTIAGLSKSYAHAVAQLNVTDKLGHKLGANSENMARATTVYNDLLAATRKAQHDGVWKKSETELLANTMAPPDKLIGNNGPAQAAQLATMARQAHASLVASEDALPVKEGWGRDARGNLVPTAGYTGESGGAPPAAPAMPFATRLGGGK